ncbi:hypothetical protein BOX15_Mlig020277g2, partial [Macrostomum lignano]
AEIFLCACMDSDEERQGANKSIFHNQPFDESLQVSDPEDIDSTYEPTPRIGGVGPGRTPDSRQQQQQHLRPGSEDSGSGRSQRMQQQPQQQPRAPARSPTEEEDDDESGSESGEESEEDDTQPIEGAYNPEDYRDVSASHPEFAELFDYIKRYTPQHIELDHRLKPFIPDFIPAVGDIDAFIKVPRPDSKPDQLGLRMLDEPCASQSDPTVLDLQLRAVGKLLVSKKTQVSRVENAERNPHAIEKWISSISELHKHKQPPTVNYTKPMPDIEQLMSEWPPEIEELLKEVGLPTSDLECDLPAFCDIVCGLLDIPVYKSRVQSLHVLFTLYSTFANSQHFRSLAEGNRLDNRLKQQPQQRENSDYDGFN